MNKILTALTLTLGIHAYAADMQFSGFDKPESAAIANGVVYVSNINGQPGAQDGNGHISKVNLDTKEVQHRWATGLDSPGGVVLYKSSLYVADRQSLVEIDLASGDIVSRYPNENAKFLNDVAVSPSGDIYVSDMFNGAIYRLSDGELTLWFQHEFINLPNGVYVTDDLLFVANWGKNMAADFTTEVSGKLYSVSLKDKSISEFSNIMGNFDGLTQFREKLYTNDFFSGTLYELNRNGNVTDKRQLSQTSADVTVSENWILAPVLYADRLDVYRLDQIIY